MFTERQQQLIDKATALGRGYAIFASNVIRQGWCSPKQEQALADMISAGEYRKNNWRGRPSRSYKHDISDTEAMQSGDYF